MVLQQTLHRLVAQISCTCKIQLSKSSYATISMHLLLWRLFSVMNFLAHQCRGHDQLSHCCCNVFLLRFLSASASDCAKDLNNKASEHLARKPAVT